MKKVADEKVLNSLNVINGDDTIFLLGAGCSINSGCMAASKLVFEFKKRIYCVNHGIQLERDVLIDETRLCEALEKEFPIGEGINPYSYFFEKCFPNAYDRNQFIKNEFHDKKPSFGYLCFANYLISKKVRYVLTTNFDLLIERAVRKINEEYDFVNVSENETPYLSGALNIVKLHGDYNYDRLKNTESELCAIPDSLLNMLLNVSAKKIFVLGYSGQDISVMSFLQTYLTKHPAAQLIWCGIEETCSNDAIKNLLDLNDGSNYMCISGFDALFEQYYRVFGPANEQLDALYIENRNTHFDLLCTNQPEQFKYNAFPLIGKARVYKTQSIIDLDRGEAFYSTTTRGKTYIIDNITSIEKIAKSHNVSITICDLCEEPISLRQKCKLIKELVKWASSESGISVYRDNLYIDNGEDIKEGLKVSVDLFNQKICLILNPNYFICGDEITSYQKYSINRKKSSLFVKQNWELLQKLINDIFAQKLVFGCEIGVEFSIDAVLQDKTQQIYECIKEPLMIGNRMQSVNQLKILDSVGPKETLFSKDEIHVGVFCCEEDKPLLKTFLDAVESGDAGKGSGVIPQYRGFLNTFKKKIIFDYDALPAIYTRALIGKSKQTIVSFYMRGLEKMYRERQIDIAVIFIGESLKGIRTDGDYDFHNTIKLLSANKYKTQLLEEKTIRSSDNRSKILLNFAIGLYTKTIGMPWYPQNYSKDTLFLGICFGRDSQGITVGCSQMFDGAGRGMQLIISQVSDKKRKNQYLSKEEAFELGKKIRQTYYRSSKVAELERIVIHRRDPFRLEEIEGFKKAFEGINDFVLLQIVEDTSFNAYPFNRYGSCGGYPVKRGTIIKASNDTAYVWTDGSVVEGDINNGRTYRNSTRGMGRPLKIKKCYGNISLNDAVSDLMYLTKMDFNSSDVLYSKLPVTIKYSRTVCDIIKQGNFSDDLISFEYVM